MNNTDSYNTDGTCVIPEAIEKKIRSQYDERLTDEAMRIAFIEYSKPFLGNWFQRLTWKFPRFSRDQLAEKLVGEGLASNPEEAKSFIPELVKANIPADKRKVNFYKISQRPEKDGSCNYGLVHWEVLVI